MHVQQSLRDLLRLVGPETFHIEEEMFSFLSLPVGNVLICFVEMFLP